MPATVIQNRAESADGSARTLLLSVEDAVSFLDAGRRQSVRSRQASRRWLDDYRAPGQQVAVRVPSKSSSGASSSSSSSHPPEEDETDFRELSRLFPLSSSPYEARRESSRLDASIIEILVDRARGGEDDQLLGSLAPGALLHVSQVIGSGFAPLFSLGLGSGGGSSSGNNDDDGYSLNAKARDRRRERTGGGRSSDVAAAAAAAGGGGQELGAELAEALEEARPLLLVASGAAGAGALRATLEWAPVAAAASASSAAAERSEGGGGGGGGGDDPASEIAAAAAAASAAAAAAASNDSDLGGGRGERGAGGRRRAQAGRVAAVLLAPDAGSAPYLKEWSLWRDAGVTVLPVYVGEKSDDTEPGDTTALEAALFSAVFGGPGGLRGLLSGGGSSSSSGTSSSSSSSVDPSEAAVLVAGLPRPVAAALVRRLCSIEGVSSERVMFGSPYF